MWPPVEELLMRMRRAARVAGIDGQRLEAELWCRCRR